MRSRKIFTNFVFTLAMVCLPCFAADKKKSGTDEGLLPLDELRTFTRVYDHVRTGYVEELTDSKLLEYAIKGMIAELDPHSAYLDKQAYAELQANTSGEFTGAGFEIGADDGVIKVIAPLDGTPAQKAGVKSGDIIVRVDDLSVKGRTLNDVSRLLRGAKDSQLKLTVQRKGMDELIDFLITRDIIHVQSVSVRTVLDDYLYIRIAQFQTNTGNDFSERLSEQLKLHPNTKGLVLDLRNNPGGVLQSSVEVADALLEKGLIVYTRGRLENSNLSYSASAGDITKGLPLVVLINSGTASASEIVAGALQDHKRAIIMGTRSFGKGSVQTIIPITEDRAIKLTTALYYTPSGRSIQARGIEPDVRLQKNLNNTDHKLIQTEADLNGHIANQEGVENTSKERESDRGINSDLLRDGQVMDAVNLLKSARLLGKPKETGQAKH